MKKVLRVMVRVSEGAPGIDIALKTADGHQEFTMEPEIAGHLAVGILSTAAAAEDARVAQVAAILATEKVSLREHHGVTVLLQELQSGLALTSTLDRQELEQLRDQIDAVLDGQTPPSIQ